MKGFFLFIICLTLYHCPNALASGGESSTSKIVFIFINFVIFLALLHYFLFRKTTGFFKGRGERISRDVDEASFAKSSALETFDDMNAKLEGVASEVKRLTDEAMTQGERIKKDALLAAKRRAEIIVAEEQDLMNAETRIVLSHLRRSLARVSVDLAEAKIRKRLDKKEHSRLIDECINEVGAVR